MEAKICKVQEKKLIGINITMNLLEDKTRILWQSFGPRIKEIQNKVGSDKISLQVYPSHYFQKFIPNTNFEKWALVEVDNFNDLPEGLNTFVLEEGLYAVFQHKGSGEDTSIFNYIYSEWIPKSKYELDNRPHFEVLGDRYRNNDTDSEEEIWIPIRE